MRFWRVGIAGNAVFFPIVSWLRRLGKSAPKNGRALPKMSAKFATRLRARAIWKSGTGALLEAQVSKICTPPARESDLEVKIIKNNGSLGTFFEAEVEKCSPRLRARAIRKSKSLKTGSLGTEVDVAKIRTLPAREIDSWKSKPLKKKHPGLRPLWRFKMLFARQAQGFRHVAKYVAGAGVCEGFKNVGRRGGFEEGPK